VAGKTYTFTEVSAPKGFEIAKAVKYTVKDTAEVQSISVTDKRISATPHVPQTGKTLPILPMSAVLITALGVGVFLSRKKKIVKKK
jgi:LPXTG-motif cell wall-anchored protein